MVGFNGLVRRGSVVKIPLFQTYRRAAAMTVAARTPQVKVDCSDASVAVKRLSPGTLRFFPTPLRIRPILRKNRLRCNAHSAFESRLHFCHAWKTCRMVQSPGHRYRGSMESAHRVAPEK